LNRRLRTGIIIAVVGVAMIAIGLFVLGRLVRDALAPLPAPTPIPVTTAKVLITTHDVAIGTMLNAEDVVQVDMPIELVPRDALKEPAEAVGKMVKTNLVANELVLMHHLADPTNVSHDLAFVIGDNQVLVAFPTGDLMSTLGVLQPGDNVDILVSINQVVDVIPAESTTGTQEDQTITKLFTFDAMQRVVLQAIIADVVMEGGGTAPVSATVVQNSSGTPVPTPTPNPGMQNVRAYLLAVSPQDALVLKHLQDAGGNFDLVLRSPTSTELFELSPVISDYLNDRYQLEYEK
jgi:Flp pilus assembly protein CpaB